MISLWHWKMYKMNLKVNFLIKIFLSLRQEWIFIINAFPPTKFILDYAPTQYIGSINGLENYQIITTAPQIELPTKNTSIPGKKYFPYSIYYIFLSQQLFFHTLFKTVTNNVFDVFLKISREEKTFLIFFLREIYKKFLTHELALTKLQRKLQIFH